MEHLKGYMFRLKPTSEQVEQLRRIAGCNRFVWNQALALQKRASEEGQKPIFYVEMSSFLTNWKRDQFPWLAESPSQALQQTLRDLDTAWKKCVQEGAGVPRFKKRGRCRESFRIPQGFRFDNRRVLLPKLGWIGFFKSREMAGEPRNITVFERAGRWYMSVCCKRDVATPLHPSASVVGVDMGITRMATVSDGTVYPPINAVRRYEKQLARAQRQLARKAKGSNRRRKARLHVSRIQEKIANVRKDYLHKVTTDLSKNHAEIVMEDLSVKNMSKSARGTTEEPGTNVRAKSRLNKAILDQGWSMFKVMLEYKQKERGGTLVLVDPAYTSQTCSACGVVDKLSRCSQAVFLCRSCGYTINADLNASINILRAGGHPVSARRGLGISQPVKREPLEPKAALGIPVL
ncbi:MAG: transposase [Sphaerochaeta sp.]|nr:transposase [Sphaerochaeta sp.]